MKAELLGTATTWLSLRNIAGEGGTISIPAFALVAMALAIIVLNYSRPGDRKWHPYPKDGGRAENGSPDYIMRRRTDMGWEYREMTQDEIAQSKRELVS